MALLWPRPSHYKSFRISAVTVLFATRVVVSVAKEETVVSSGYRVR